MPHTLSSFDPDALLMNRLGSSSKESNSSKKRGRDEIADCRGARNSNGGNAAQMPSKRLKRNEYGSLIMDEVAEEEVENSSQSQVIKFERQILKEEVVEETIPEMVNDNKNKDNGV